MKVEYLKSDDSELFEELENEKECPKRVLKKRKAQNINTNTVYKAKSALVSERELSHFLKTEFNIEVEQGVNQKLSDIIKEICRHVIKDKNDEQSILKVSDFT